MLTDLIIIMPLYNESQTIKNTLNLWINTLEKLNINYIIEIYNDGSTDNSSDVIKNINNPKIKLIENPHQGFSKTLYNAYKNVEETEFVFHADSDDEISPVYFEEFWQNRNNADLIIGKRIHREQSIYRKIATNMATYTISFLYGKGITDTNIPFRLLKRKDLQDFIKTFPENFLYPNLFLCAYFLKNKKKIIEIPVEYYNKIKRKSHLNNIIKLIIHSIISFIELFLYKL